MFEFLGNLFGTGTRSLGHRSSSPARSRRVTLGVECLEERQLMSAAPLTALPSLPAPIAVVQSVAATPTTLTAHTTAVAHAAVAGPTTFLTAYLGADSTYTHVWASTAGFPSDGSLFYIRIDNETIRVNVSGPSAFAINQRGTPEQTHNAGAAIQMVTATPPPVTGTLSATMNFFPNQIGTNVHQPNVDLVRQADGAWGFVLVSRLETPPVDQGEIAKLIDIDVNDNVNNPVDRVQILIMDATGNSRILLNNSVPNNLPNGFDGPAEGYTANVVSSADASKNILHFSLGFHVMPNSPESTLPITIIVRQGSEQISFRVDLVSVNPPLTVAGQLSAGQGLTAGQSITSPDGRFNLIYQTDGNLVLYGPGHQALWNSQTWGKPTGVAIMQTDGNLVVYDPNGHALWNSRTWGHPGAGLTLQNDGNLVIYDANGHALWNTMTFVPPMAANTAGRLTANQGLLRGQSISSPDGRFTLSFQQDGNLVLYGPTHKALWASHTDGRSVWEAIMQADGNLVIYDRSNHSLWNSGTWGHAGAALTIGNDGNLAIRDANNNLLWATHTAVLSAEQSLTPGQSMISQDGRFSLILQTDGNLVLYGPGNKALWNSHTDRHGVSRAILQADGNLVVYDTNGRALWNSGSYGHSGDVLTLQNDGNLVIYDSIGHVLWASHTAG